MYTNRVEVFALAMLMLIHQLHDQPISLHSTVDTVSISPSQFQFLVRLHTVIEVFVVLALLMQMPRTLVPTTREAIKKYNLKMQIAEKNDLNSKHFAL